MPGSSLPKRFETSPRDTPRQLAAALGVHELGFADLSRNRTTASVLLDVGFPRMKRILKIQDAAMKKLLIESGAPRQHLQAWNERMTSCSERADFLEGEIPLLDMGPWRWEGVIKRLAWIAASIELSNATLEHNSIRIDG